MQRLKINGLVVIEVHQRDIIDKLYKSGCKDTGAFEWLAQLRFYWEKVSTFVEYVDWLGIHSGLLKWCFHFRKKTTAMLSRPMLVFTTVTST